MLLAHTDVVPAPTADWTVPPFEGRLREGRVLGRGAGDMKGELAARAVAIADLARSGEPPAGDVVLIAESDEERNTAGVGMSWLIEERPDLRCDFALNEGGGLLLELADGPPGGDVAVGEKQVDLAADPDLRRARGTRRFPTAPTTPSSMRRRRSTGCATTDPRARPAVGPKRRSPRSALRWANGADPVAWGGRQHPVLADLLPAMTRMTVTPTGLETFEPSNVIPPFVDLTCDCRALAGQSESEIRDHVHAALGNDFGYEVELLEPLAGGTESEIDTPLYELIADYVDERLGARLLPFVSPGFSDSHWVRRGYGTVAYGFAPVFHTDPDEYMRGAHGADESIEVSDLVEMAEFHLHALKTLGC